MNSFFTLLSLYVVLFASTVASTSEILAFEHTDIHNDLRTNIGQGTIPRDMIVVERSSQAAWQATSIAVLKKKLISLKHELGKVRESNRCLSKRIGLIRRLRRKLRYSHCGMKNTQKAKRICKTKSHLGKRLRITRRKCAWKRACIVQKVRPIVRRIKYARMACLCVRKETWTKHLNQLKSVKCPKTRSKFAIRAEMRKARARINYLKKLMHPHPSSAPRANPKPWRDNRRPYRNGSHRRGSGHRVSVRTASELI